MPVLSSCCFERLIRDGSLQSAYQQAVFLREYLNALYLCKQMNNDDATPLRIPWINSQDIQVYFGIQNADRECFLVDDEGTWKTMERACSLHSAPLVYHMNSAIDNSTSVQVPVGQQIDVILTVSNLLDIPLLMTDVQLMSTFEAEADENDHSDFQFNAVTADVLDEVPLPGHAADIPLVLSATCHRRGFLNITGVAYGLASVSFSDSELGVDAAQSYCNKMPVVYGYQLFNIRGRRLNSNKEERMTVVYAPDKRLEPHIVDSCPSLRIRCESSVVVEVLEDQLFFVPFTLENVGTLPIHKVTACATPNSNVLFTVVDGSASTDVSPRSVLSAVRTLEADAEGFRKKYLTFSLLAEGEMLPPAHTLYRICWIRAGGCFGDENDGENVQFLSGSVSQSHIKLVFYWHSELPNTSMPIRCRTFRLTYRYVCRKAIKLTCHRQRLSDHLQNDSGEHCSPSLLVDLNVQNIANLAGLAGCEIKLLGIIAHSADGYRIGNMISTKKDYVLQPGQSGNVCFDVRCSLRDKPADSFLPLSGVFSSGQMGNEIFDNPWHPSLVHHVGLAVFVSWSATWPAPDPTAVIGQSIVDDSTSFKASPWLWCGQTTRRMIVRRGECNETKLFLAVFTPCVLDLSSKLSIAVHTISDPRQSSVALRSHFITVRPIMASPTTGIQQLLAAEKKAAEQVNEARKRKARRLKQAKEEAQQEIDKYRTVSKTATLFIQPFLC
ncbi:unnamed protein product [Soboliphyme baturini]|uniref:Integrin_alpha2 domain-containing protein n=1 Tax=Soboliphyme baturini TaxID=241478 RepID=A0A183J2H4_9BILA|nr:unnamed protein product [Soboliphyme baturini]